MFCLIDISIKHIEILLLDSPINKVQNLHHCRCHTTINCHHKLRLIFVVIGVDNCRIQKILKHLLNYLFLLTHCANLFGAHNLSFLGLFLVEFCVKLLEFNIDRESIGLGRRVCSEVVHSRLQPQ